MRILIANETYYPNVDGSSYFTHRLAFYLKKRNHDVLVVAPSHSFRSHFSEEYDNVRCFRVWSVPVFINDRHFSLPFFIKNKIEKVIDDFNPEIVHLQQHFFVSKAVFDIARQKNIPVIGTNHYMPENISHYIPLPFLVRRKIEKLAWTHFKWVFDRLDIVTTPTQSAANILYNIGLSKKIIPVSNGIDLEKFQPDYPNAEIKNKYNLPNKPLLLYVGRLDKDKRIEVILRAMPLILKENDLYFVVVGKGAEAKNLKKLTKELNIDSRVIFTGFVPDEELPSIYNLVDCFVIACPVELQSLVTMEAMASGLPVVAVNALALPELVHHGENGFLFEVDDYQTLAEEVIKIFSDNKLRKRMSLKSLEIIKQHDIENTINTFETLYQQAKSQ